MREREKELILAMAVCFKVKLKTVFLNYKDEQIEYKKQIVDEKAYLSCSCAMNMVKKVSKKSYSLIRDACVVESGI